MHYKLRPSSALRWVTLAFALCCAYAVWRALAPRAGAAVGVSAAFITAFMLVCFARRADAGRPVAIQIGQHGVTTWHRVGESVRFARLIGVNYCNRFLLSITLQDSQGGVATVLIFADALPREDLRELAVRCRYLCQ